MRLPLFLSACFLLAACSRSGVLDKSASIVGKWEQAASQNISGSWIESDASKIYVDFTNDGKMIISNGEHLTINDYVLTPDGKLKIVGNGWEVMREYNIEWNILLTLGGPCFEPCFVKYKRVSGF